MRTTASNNRKEIISLCISLGIVVLEIIGGIMSTMMLPIEQFMYYTQNSNYFLLLTTLIWIVGLLRYLRNGIRIPRWICILKYMATCMVSLTFVVALCVLGPMFGDIAFMMLGSIALYFHTLCPLLAIVDFLLFVQGQEWKKSHVLLAMLPTMVYAIIAALMNILKVWHGPYPFLFVYENPVWLSCIWAIVIPGIAWLLASLLRAGNRLFTREYTY